MSSKLPKHLGYQGTEYSNSEDAFIAFKINPDDFDLLITDMTMPDKTGDKLAKKYFL